MGHICRIDHMKKISKPVLVVLALAFVVVLPVPPATLSLTLRVDEEKPSVFPDVEIEAHSALVLDLVTGKIFFEKNINEPMPLASVTKIISALVVADHIIPDEYIEVTKNAVETPEPSTLRVGEHLRAQDLLALAMGESSNDAMMALTESLGDEKWFLELMQQKARELGAKTMSFLNPTGLDTSPPERDIISFSPPLLSKERGLGGGVASNYGSAWDLAQIVKNSLDSVIWQVGEKEEIISQEKIVHNIRHTNTLKKEIPGIFGAKTGFTDNAGGNLVLIVEKPVGKPKLIIILGSTLEARFEDAKKLLSIINLTLEVGQI